MAKKGELHNPLKGKTMHTAASEQSDPYQQEGIQEFLRLLRRGNYESVASRKSGIHPNKLIYWKSAARRGKEPYATFITEMEQAKAEHEVNTLELVQESEDPRMQLEILERRYSSRWAKVKKIQKEAEVEITEFLDYMVNALENHPEAKELIISIAEAYEPVDTDD